MKRTYNAFWDDNQLLLEHWRGEWHIEIARYTQNRKVCGSNLNALGQTLGRNFIARLPVTFRWKLKYYCNWHQLREAASLPVAQSWSWRSQMADIKKIEQFLTLFYFEGRGVQKCPILRFFKISLKTTN